MFFTKFCKGFTFTEALDMEATQLLINTKNSPGEDESWLEPGWLTKTCIDLQTRAGIIDWLIQCQQYLGLSDCCLHSAVANFDVALSHVEWDDSEIQLIALACLLISAKLEVDSPPSASLLLPLAGDVYTKVDLGNMEMELMQILDWNVRQTTASVFLQFYADLGGKGRKPLFKMAKAVLDLCLYQEWYGCQKPSKLASSCLAAASCLLGQTWCEDLTQFTGSSLKDLSKGLRLSLLACASAQCEGYGEKHGKCARNIMRLKHGITGMVAQL